MATVVKSFAIQGIDGYSIDIETKMLEGQCLWQGKAYFAATMERRIIEELFDDEIIFTKWDPELVDVYIEDEGREWELVEFSFFSKYANPLYPKETCSPLGMIVGKFYA